MSKIILKTEYCPNPQAFVIHTNFNIQSHEALRIIIETMEGVEDIDTWSVHKYSFLVIIGSIFDREQIAKSVTEKVISYFQE